MMKPLCSIIIPTWNNPEFLNPCIDSIASTNALNGLCELVIVNNGSQPIKEYVRNLPNTRVLEPGSNLGWERGLQYGLDNTDTEYVCFQNDDTVIPKATQNFYDQLLWPFRDTNVAAVGPATTIAAGWHSVYQKNNLRWITEVSFLIFFTVMMRRDYLIEAGGIDTSAPGGDDLDLSIRLRKMGKKLLINPDAFLIHHAFKTGTRVRGGADKPGGWNSKEMTDRTNQWLIQKHGFKTFMETMRGLAPVAVPTVDSEGDTIRDLVRGSRVVELGCGFRKTVPQSIGVDIVGKGEKCNHLGAQPSVADIVADVSGPIPEIESGSVDTIIARHILEHIINPIAALKHWEKLLKPGGRLIIAVPNHQLRNTIPLNPEHVAAYAPDNLTSLLSLAGWKKLEIVDPNNGISFIGVFEKTSVESAVEKERVAVC